MKVFHRTADLQTYLQNRRTNNRSVGFVPTMGALHQGHLSLVALSQQEHQLTVVSIFVNPTQFNDPEDLRKYPRTPGKDLELLASVGCDLVFLPQVEEVYSPEWKEGAAKQAPLVFGSLDQTMEGAMRPGHFAGVAQVVERLLELTHPDVLYLGQKDYQQLVIVQSMVAQRALPLLVKMVPTVREADGLAMSSRNQRLLPTARQSAPEIYRILEETKAAIAAGGAVELLCQQALDRLAQVPELKPEYLLLADGESLLPLNEYDGSKRAVLATAVWAGEVRLIDNVILEP